MMIYTVELGLKNVTTSTNSTLYFSTDGFVTLPTDTPANIAFEPRLIDPGSISVNLIEDNGIFNDATLDVGEIAIANIDGYYDYLINPTGDDYICDGKALVIRYGDQSGAYPSTFTTLFQGTCDGIEVTYDKLIIRAKDNAYLLDKSLLTDTYAGNNVLPNGVEGRPEDIKGELKPWMWGPIANVELKCCNTSKLIYKVNQGYVAGEYIYAIYDKGIALTAGADYSSQSDMETNAPLSGYFRRWPAGGHVRLGSTPAGKVTADAVKGTSTTLHTVAQTMKAILAVQSLVPLAADVTALDALNSRQVCIFIDTDISIREALGKVARSIGAYFYYDRLSQLHLGRFIAPEDMAGTPFALQEYNILDIEHIATPANKPYSKYILEYYNVETPQSKDELAASVPQSTKERLKKAYNKSIYVAPGISSGYNSNKQLRITTRFTVEAHCIEEVTRLSTMFASPRRCYEVTIHINDFNFEVMQLFSLTHYRFGLNNTLCVLISYTLNLSENNAVLKLWG